jgi:hypothetical protein
MPMFHESNAYNRGILDFCDGTIATILGFSATLACPFEDKESLDLWLLGQQDAAVHFTSIPSGYALLVVNSPIKESDMFLNLSLVNNRNNPWRPVDQEDINHASKDFAAIIRKGF